MSSFREARGVGSELTGFDVCIEECFCCYTQHYVAIVTTRQLLRTFKASRQDPINMFCLKILKLTVY